MKKGNKCLLIVDVQNGFINKNTKHIPPLIEQIQYKYDIVFITKFFNRKGSFYRKLIGWDKLTKNSKEFDLAFTPRKDAIIIEKDIYTCINNLFLSSLSEKNIKQVFICGIDTDICVTKCAVDLFENSIVPIVIQDYCASNAGSEAHINAIKTLKRFIGAKQIIKS